MGSSRGQKQQETTLQNNAAADAAAIKQTPLEAKLEARSLGFLNDIDSSKDVSQYDALKPNLDLFNSASNDQQNDRQSNGILNLANGGNSAQAMQYSQYLKNKRQQDAAGGLENAYNRTYADITGNIAPNLIAQQNNRQLGKAQLSQGAYTSYLNRVRQPSLFDKLLGAAQKGAQTAAAFA